MDCAGGWRTPDIADGKRVAANCAGSKITAMGFDHLQARLGNRVDHRMAERRVSQFCRRRLERISRHLAVRHRWGESTRCAVIRSATGLSWRRRDVDDRHRRRRVDSHIQCQCDELGTRQHRRQSCQIPGDFAATENPRHRPAGRDECDSGRDDVRHLPDVGCQRQRQVTGIGQFQVISQQFPGSNVYALYRGSAAGLGDILEQ